MTTIVTSTPEPALVYTNRVYVSASSPSDEYIELGKAANKTRIYQTVQHPGIPDGRIGLSSVQRETCGVSLNEPPSFFGKAPKLGTLPVLVELDLIVHLTGIKVVTLQTRDIVSALRRVLTRQVLSASQTFSIDCQGTAVILTCQSLQVAAVKDAEAMNVSEGTRGRYVEETRINVTAADHPNNRRLKLQQDSTVQIQAVRFNPNMSFTDLGIGGLDGEFDKLLRRAFVSRGADPELVRKLGMRHVKGILLWGPAGTGKTLIARKIGALLNGPNKVEPKVVNGPELLNKFVGESEKNLRALFEDARNDQKEKGDASPLHVIIFDEIDSLFKTRGRDGGGGAGVGDTIVNQMLSQMDGVEALNNILVIGMTNRRELIDPALLRPGRLEVHLEIGLPDAAGRKQIFDIHMKTMRDNGRVSQDVDLPLLVTRTKNYSGAEIEGVVKAAASTALYERMSIKEVKLGLNTATGNDVIVDMGHFLQAIDDVRPAFGVDEDRLAHLTTTQPMIDIGPRHRELLVNCQRMIQQALEEKDPSATLFTLLLTGETGSGTTTLAAHLATASGFPFVRFLSSDQFVGKSEAVKIQELTRTFEDAYRSTASLIVLDSLERLIEFIGVGPRFSAAVLQTLLVLLARTPPHGRRLVVVGTTSREQQVEQLELVSSFQVRENVPPVSGTDETRAVLQHVKSKVPGKLLDACLTSGVAIRTLLAVLRAAKTQSPGRVIQEDTVLAAMRQCGVSRG